MKTRLLFLCFFFLQCWASAQVPSSFFYRPGLEVTLPSTEWKVQKQTYEQAMWNPRQHHIRNQSKGISIAFVCELLDKMEVAPDSMLWLTEERIKFQGLTFKKQEVNGFTLYALGSPTQNERYSFVAEKIHPWGYFVSMSIEIPSKNRRDADTEAREILEHFFMRTPSEIDKLLGLPYPSNLDRDSLVAARKDEIRKKSKGLYPKDYVEAELKKISPEDLLWDATDGYCWDKLYRLRANYAAGKLGLEEALNHLLLGIDSPDIELFQSEFRMDGGCLSSGIQILIGRSLVPAIDTSKYKYYCGAPEIFYDGDETYYWSLAQSMDSLGCLLICFYRQDSNWSIHHRQIDYTRGADGGQICDHLERQFDDPHDWTGEPQFPKKHRLNTVQTFPRGPSEGLAEQWVFNAMVPTSNCLPLANLIPASAQFDVTYAISSLDDLNDRAVQYRPINPPNFRDSIRFEALYGNLWQVQSNFDAILQNPQLKEKICGNHYLCEYLSPKSPDSEDPDYAQDWEEEKSMVEAAAREILASGIGPERRRYQSPLLFIDLDHDHEEEMVQFTLTKGGILDYFVIKASENGVEFVAPSSDWRKRISELPECINIQRIANMDQNILARFGED